MHVFENKKLNFFLFILGVLFLTSTFYSLAWTRPPTEVQAQYNPEKKSLHLEIKHISEDPTEHFIRKIFIFKEGKEIKKKYYTRQTSASRLIDDIPLELSADDTIFIKVFCNQGGAEEVSLDIPENEEK